MKPSVYIETTIISYLAARPGRDLITAANQQLTHDWWETRRDRFTLLVSPAVLREAGHGHPVVAAGRMNYLSDLPLLEISFEVQAPAGAFTSRGPLLVARSIGISPAGDLYIC
jgi:hypothetical protein